MIETMLALSTAHIPDPYKESRAGSPDFGNHTTAQDREQNIGLVVCLLQFIQYI